MAGLHIVSNKEKEFIYTNKKDALIKLDYEKDMAKMRGSVSRYKLHTATIVLNNAFNNSDSARIFRNTGIGTPDYVKKEGEAWKRYTPTMVAPR